MYYAGIPLLVTTSHFDGSFAFVTALLPRSAHVYMLLIRNHAPDSLFAWLS